MSKIKSNLLLAVTMLLPVLYFTTYAQVGVSPSRQQQQGNAIAAYVFGAENSANAEELAEAVVNNLTADRRYAAPQRGAREFFREANRAQARSRGRLLSDRDFCRIGDDFGVNFLVIIDIERQGRSNSVWARILDLGVCRVIATAEYTGLIRNANEIRTGARALSDELLHARIGRRGTPAVAYASHGAPAAPVQRGRERVHEAAVPETPNQTPVFIVNSPDEFVNAIGSDRIIQLRGSTISLSDLPSTRQGPNYRFEEVFDGHELVIFGVNNMKIVGLGSKQVEVVTKPIYSNVLVFKNCENITIENVYAGHSQGGECTGGVFKMVDSKNFTINNSTLYGSGMEGITAENVTGLRFNNSVIRGCSYHIMTLKNSSDFEFNNSEFTGNKEFDLVNISNSNNIRFKTCRFTNNQTGITSWSDYALFNIVQSTSIILEDCLIENNNADHYIKTDSPIEARGVRLVNNTFRKGDYKQ